MKYLAILAMLPSIALAQGVTWSSTTGKMDYTSCCANGACWFESGMICHSDPADRHELFLKPGVNVTATGPTWITAAPPPKCPDGYSLVDAGRPMCAKELIEPTR